MTEELSGPLTIDHAVQLVDEAAATAEDDHDVSISLRHSLSSWVEAEQADSQPRAALWILWAFEYYPKESPADHDFFQPWMIFGDGTANMPYVRDLPSECLEWWSQIAERVNELRARARLEHLLFLRRYGNGGVRARRAAESYLAVASSGRDIHAVHAVRIALELSRRTGQNDVAKTAIELTTKLATDALTENDPAPGVVLRLLETLQDENDAPADVGSLLEQARVKYAGQVHHEDTVIHLQLKHLTNHPDRAARIWSDRVNIWIAAGDAAEPVVRTMHFKKAIEHARSSGDRSLVERATARLQSVRLEDLGLTPFSIEISLPPGQLEETLRPITEADDWRIALIRFARLGPITGNLEYNRRLTEELTEQFPISHLFPRVLLGGDGLPRFTPTTEDEKSEYHLARHEVQLLQLNATLVLEALVRVIHKHEIPPLHDLTEHFARNPVIPSELAAAIGRAFLRFWSGDAEGAVFAITPRIEALARNLLLAGDAGIYRIQRQNTPGQYPGLRVLLDELLKRGMDPSWHRFIFVLCAHVAGMNFRNELSHGFVDDASDGTAAVLLQAAAYLATLCSSKEQ
jgi:hypothetical protein